MLASLKAAPLLNGFRGAAKADVAALSQLISQVSVLAARHAREISEIELNPVLVHARRAGRHDRRRAGGARRTIHVVPAARVRREPCCALKVSERR